MSQEEQTWEEVKEIWGSSAKGAKINFQVKELYRELMDKVGQFEKDSIKSDLHKIKSAWDKEKKYVSRFEKKSVRKDIHLITRLIKKLLDKFKSKKG